MKVRNRTICQTCRTRKIGCDGKKPACSQCTHTARQCSYLVDFIFLSDTTLKCSNEAPERSKKKNSTPCDKSLTQRPLVKLHIPINLRNRTPSTPFQDMVLLVMQNFMPEAELVGHSQNAPTQPRICGNWVEVLPMLSIGGQGQALPSSIICLAASISHLRQKSYSSYAMLLEKYGSAMRLLKKELAHPHTDISSRDEVAAAIMCLTLTETILPTSSTGWWRHVDGVGEWMRLLGPEPFSLGIRHRLFTGFRPLLIIKAFLSRRASFLSNEDWKRRPFEVQKETSVQRLLTEVACIPTILELIDTLDYGTPSGAALIAKEAISMLLQTYSDLQDWGDHLDGEPSTGLFCWTVKSSNPWAWDGHKIWFPSISAANLIMHLWAFKVVCLTEVQRLQTRFPDVPCDWPVKAGCGVTESLREVYLGLCVKIVQSMEFLFQDGLALFGPLSIGLPLTAARETFEMDGERSVVLLKLTQDIVQGSILSEIQLGAPYLGGRRNIRGQL
ncbi:hypothetical protein FOXYSP1_02491 [Fusarium oxysporum f. sp. phaseoli]